MRGQASEHRRLSSESVHLSLKVSKHSVPCTGALQCSAAETFAMSTMPNTKCVCTHAPLPRSQAALSPPTRAIMSTSHVVLFCCGRLRRGQNATKVAVCQASQALQQGEQLSRQLRNLALACRNWETEDGQCSTCECDAMRSLK